MAVFNNKTIKILSIIMAAIIGIAIAFLINTKIGDHRNFSQAVIPIQDNELDIVYGADSALITIYLYSSYNCIFCQKFFNEVYPPLKTEYLDRKKVRLVVKLIDLTYDEAILRSLKLAVCINKFGNFEAINKLLLADPKVVYTHEFLEVTEELINNDSFIAECMLGGKAEKYISYNINEFKNLGLTGTPAFVIGNKIIRGYIEYNIFKNIIEKELSNALE